MARPSPFHSTPGTSIGGLVGSILADPDQGTLRSVVRKSLAVGSGKGGVGKTITACNLSLHFARKGMRVGLVDLDPLSDVASLLDLYESEQALRDPAAPSAAGGVKENIDPGLPRPGDPLPLAEAGRQRAQPPSWRSSTAVC